MSLVSSCFTEHIIILSRSGVWLENNNNKKSKKNKTTLKPNFVLFVTVSVNSNFSLFLAAVHFHLPLFNEKILILPGIWSLHYF